MSSWKNAHKSYQKPHRERHQPEDRKHLGLLEKKKDYKLRADDYNSKKNELKLLQRKALDRNPDEFYFHMINAQVEEGEHKDKAKKIDYTPEQLQLMQTQDYKYISNRRTMEAKKVEKLQATLHQLDESEEPQNKHTFFVDTPSDVKKFNLAKQLGTSKTLLKRRFNRLPPEKLGEIKIFSKNKSKNKDEAVQEVVKEKRRAYKLLEAREDRSLKLIRLQRKLELKRALQDKKREVKRRIEPPNREAAPIYEFKRERKR